MDKTPGICSFSYLGAFFQERAMSNYLKIILAERYIVTVNNLAGN